MTNHSSPRVVLQPLYHRGSENIAIHASRSAGIDQIVRKIPNIRWSQTHKCWYLPLSQDGIPAIKEAFHLMADVDSTHLDLFIKKKKALGQTLVGPSQASKDNVHLMVATSYAWKLCWENCNALQQFVEHLKLKAYSPSTIKTYRNEFLQLLRLLNQKPVYELTQCELRRYFLYCLEQQKIKENTMHSRINAIKFYFEQVLRREKFFWEIPRPKKPAQLPKLLNEEEIEKIFNALSNKKHKAMLFAAYSAGLRVSEIVQLKLRDIDSSRMQIFIERAKGKKDRYVNLSPVLLDVLRSYVKNCMPKPKVYLFESSTTGTAFPVRTVQQIFANAKRRAGIKKQIGFHSLRHSFATHLLEKGTDIKYIKDLLGHFDIRTTERYLHVTKKQLVNIVSPLDDLWNKGNIDW